MPRAARYLGEDMFNHCIIRGIDKHDIFFDDKDRIKFIKLLSQYKDKYDIKIGTYALMPNHVHLVVLGKDKNISKFFQSILISYSFYFNKKYERVGHLFENRYKNKVINTYSYMKNVVKYIHYNPEKAGISKFMDYKWSGYKEFFKKSTLIDKNMILLYYNEDVNQALKEFKQEHFQDINRYYEDFAEFEMVNRLTDEQVKIIIDNRIERISGKKHDIFDKTVKESIIKEVLKIKGVSVNQISRVTGINRRLLAKMKDKQVE